MLSFIIFQRLVTSSSFRLGILLDLACFCLQLCHCVCSLACFCYELGSQIISLACFCSQLPFKFFESGLQFSLLCQCICK